ncbi:MAG: GC-type dockerin domain-anchored protein [Phycisphaerales bacterium]
MKTQAIMLVLLGAAGAACAQPEYTVTDLGSIGNETAAWAISDSGLVAGVALDQDNAAKGFLWDSGVLAPIDPDPAFTQAQSMGVADDGSVALLSFSLGKFDAQASLVVGGAAVDLGGFAPHAIGADGRVLGTSGYTTGAGFRAERACMWDGALNVLAPVSGSEWSLATDSNAAGWIVGHAVPSGALKPIAALWIGSTPSSLGTLGGSWSTALGINAARQVVGIAENAGGMPHAFRFDLSPAGAVLTRTDLGALAGDNSAAYGINDAGTIVGTSHGHAFVWDGTMRDLNALVPAGEGWTLQVATGINANGQIVGWGLHGPDGQRAFLLTPASCPADINGDGVLNLDDINLFAGAFLAGDLAADMNGDGVLNLDDINLFAAGFLAGCP